MNSPAHDISEIFSKASGLLVENNWDIPAAGRHLDSLNCYHGPDRNIREQTKAAGRALQLQPVVFDQLVGYVLECYGHYYASQEAAFDQKRQHPEFREYFQHWFYSDTEYVRKSAREVLLQWIKKPGIVKIQHGKTLWRQRRRASSSIRARTITQESDSCP
ncbi:hypothetical protein [Azonexus sp.]|uniref:hypothetical protein n=1 Tax=Azonexus sp. TaxID=1872668 RepID=UPI0035AE6285